MPAAVESSLDVALWLIDRAIKDSEYLQPQKLQRLMFLAQAYYAATHAGRRLMPAVFVADDVGPIEPNVYRILEAGRPHLEVRRIPDRVQHFLDGVWRRFGPHSTDHLSRLLRSHPPYAEAWQRGRLAEISIEAMAKFYAASGRGTEAAAPPVSEVLRSRVLRSQTGKPVAVTQWLPPSQASQKK